jgi:hypothetical protein
VPSAFAEIANALRIDPAGIAWGTGDHEGAVVAWYPWARVLIGRSPAQAQTIAEAWATGRNRWPLDALQRTYPVLLGATAADRHGDGAWTTPAALLATLQARPEGADTAVTFLRWALAAPGPHWRCLPSVEVRGLWEAWRDAALLLRSDGKIQLRARQDADFTAPFPLS